MGDNRDIDAWRRRERRRLLAKRMAISPEQHHRWSDAIERRLAPLLDGLAGAVIGLYWPVKAEFDPRPLADRLTGGGRALALPVIRERAGILEYRSWSSEMEMTSGTYDIPVPKVRRPARPDIVVVPLLGFDDANYRLGYGGGYFDRTIAAMTARPITIGVGFEAGRLASIFPRAHDIAMDLIVSEAQVQRKGGGSSE